MLRLVFFLVVVVRLAWTAVWVVNHPGTVAVQWLDQELDPERRHRDRRAARVRGWRS